MLDKDPKILGYLVWFKLWVGGFLRFFWFVGWLIGGLVGFYSKKNRKHLEM